MLSDKTLAIIKPDVSPYQTDEIMQLIELKGFTIITKSYRQLTTATAERLFADQRNNDNYGDLIQFMTSAPCWLMVLSKIEAVTAWQYALGPEDPMEARMAAPRSLRALFGGGGLRNALHGSASKEAAAVEIKLLFPDLPCAYLGQEEAEARAYIAIKLQATLNKALTALARQKPTSDKDAALNFLAEWLLANNPNKPQVVAPEGAQSSSSSVAAAAQRAASEDLSVLLRRQELAQHELQDVIRDSSAARAAPRVPKPGQLAQQDVAQQDVAATKVQAAFRGHQARKQVQAMKTAQPPAGAAAGAAATAGADASAEPEAAMEEAVAAGGEEVGAAAAAEAEAVPAAIEAAEAVAAAVEAA